MPDAPLGLEFFLAEAPQQPSPARARLGRWLFFDKRLSRDGTIACATCHRPEYAFSEPLAVPVGIDGRTGTRKTPSLTNLAATTQLMGAADPPAPFLFWDGRSTSLEDQALVPIQNPAEMGNTLAAMVETLSNIAGYRPYFLDAFGSDQVTTERVAAAIADYERTLTSGNSPFDRWRFGDEPDAVSDLAKQGYNLFTFDARCAQCHAGSNFTDNRFHNLGLGWDPDAGRFVDEGRFAITGVPQALGTFKTPSLRDVSRRAPYMHDGSLATLRDVVEFYNRGGIDSPNQSGRLIPLNLSPAQIDALVAFLETLDGDRADVTGPSRFPE